MIPSITRLMPHQVELLEEYRTGQAPRTVVLDAPSEGPGGHGCGPEPARQRQIGNEDQGVSLKPAAKPTPVPFHQQRSGTHRSATTMNISTRSTCPNVSVR